MSATTSAIDVYPHVTISRTQKSCLLPPLLLTFEDIYPHVTISRTQNTSSFARMKTGLFTTTSLS